MLQNDVKTVLVIDDDLIIRKLISFHLKKNDFTVHLANSSDEGFSFLSTTSIDLVLCDVGMEGMDGYTFCKKVRENEKYRTLPFIFVSANTSIEDKEKALAVGADDYITKPFNVQELILKVRALIRRTEILTLYGQKNLNKPLQENRSEEDTSGNGENKVLLVDDDPSLSRLFHYNLTKAGYVCKTAENGKEGFEIAKTFFPDVIVSDIMMPEMDGFEFRKILLEHNELKSVPFIFLTAKGAEEDILDGYDLGITDYIIKTSGPRVVVAKVTAILNSIGKIKQKMVSDLHKAADGLRVKVVSDTLPILPGFEICQWHQPFQGIPGGDFIDYFEVESNRLIVILGDVMGKKWNAWYFAVAYAGYIRSAIRVALQNTTSYSPKELMEQVNSIIYNDSKISEVFSTLSVLLLDANAKIIRYCGAGDLPVFYRSIISKTTIPVSSNGLLLGFSDNGFYDEQVFHVQNGDELVLITDGIIESRNENGEQFGTNRLLGLIDSLKDGDDSIEVIKREFLSYTNNKCEDDISLINIKIKKG